MEQDAPPRLPVTERDPAFPGPLHAMVLVFCLLALQGLVGGLLSAIPRPPALHNIAFIVGTSNLVAAGVIYLFVRPKTPSLVPDCLRWPPAATRVIAPLVMASLGLVILLSELDNVTRAIFPMPKELAKAMTETESSGLWSLLLVAVIAPVTEEVLFRGIFLRAFLFRYGAAKAIAVSTALFVITHLNPYQFFAPVALGILLGYLYVRTRSLGLCIIGHAIYNAVVNCSAQFLPFNIPGFSVSDLSDFNKVEFQPIWFTLLGAAAAWAGVAWIVFVLHRDKQREDSAA